MAMDQEAWEAVGKVDLCRDGCELLLPRKGLGRRKKLLGLVALKMNVGQWK